MGFSLNFKRNIEKEKKNEEYEGKNMIEILNYEPLGKNKVIGYVDILIPAMNVPKMIIRRIAHLQSGEKKWFNLPSYVKDKPNGEKQYIRYWQFEFDAHNGQLLDKLTERVAAYCHENKIAEIQPVSFAPSHNFSQQEELPF
jgi:hypothetical protein